MFKTLLLKEIKLIIRDIHALLALFLMPVTFILIMSLSLQSAYSERGSNNQTPTQLKIFAVFEQKIPLTWQKDFSTLTGFDVKQINSQQQTLNKVKQQVLAGQRYALVKVPYRLVKALVQRDLIRHPIEIYYSPITPNYIRTLLEASLLQKIVKKKIAITFPRSPFSIRDNNKIPDLDMDQYLGKNLFKVSDYGTDKNQKRPSSVQQSVPAWLVFAMFFIIIPFSSTLLTEINNGTLGRLNTFPIARQWILLGKCIPYILINLIQAFFMFLTGVFLVPLFGGEALYFSDNMWLLFPISLAVSIMATSFALFIATWVQSYEQASIIGGVSNMLMAAIGGVMVPTFIMPETMQKLAQFSPMNWGLEGFLEILIRQGDFISIMPYLIKLLSLAFIFFILAYFALQKKLA